MREWSEGFLRFRVPPEDEAAHAFLAERGHDFKEAWQDPYEYPDGVTHEGFWMKVIESRDIVGGLLCWNQLAVPDLLCKNPESWEPLADMCDQIMERLRKEARKQCSNTDCYEPGHALLAGPDGRAFWFCEEHYVLARAMIEQIG